ncbi:RNA-directed DNA polymerase from mobile element jockey [Aphis craccivora]|uniref:RNA-directed DNA polymerase from mobile element jockey n=1 Tax=Aphis craccivora TaxID=307492 RepID=A0A6G0YR78_APHCR|nr:RNA-directed DNA polymerase from mobile element jockey [Aphis craccivora]
MVFKCVKCLETSSHKEDILKCSMCYTEQNIYVLTVKHIIYTNLQNLIQMKLQLTQETYMYRNLLNDLIRKSKQLNYQNKLLIAQSDNKQVWKIINEVIGKSNKSKIIKKDGLITESKKEIYNVN